MPHVSDRTVSLLDDADKRLEVELVILSIEAEPRAHDAQIIEVDHGGLERAVRRAPLDHPAARVARGVGPSQLAARSSERCAQALASACARALEVSLDLSQPPSPRDLVSAPLLGGAP